MENLTKNPESKIQQVENTTPPNKSNKALLKKTISSFNALGKLPRIIILVCAVIICLFLITSVFVNKEGKFTVISESSLKEMLIASEFSSLEYTYNSIATVTDKEITKYHVSYKGTVKIGFDFKDISLSHNKEEKKITITLPETKLISSNVDDKSLDFIFVKKKYATETVFQEAYKKCSDDLRKKATKNENLNKLAKESAISSVKAFLAPWESELPDDYVIEYK